MRFKLCTNPDGGKYLKRTNSEGLTKMETKEQLNKYLEKLSKEYDALIAKHGHGVRPSYVSADLDNLSYRIAKAREQLALLDIESPCDEWHGSYGKGQL